MRRAEEVSDKLILLGVGSMVILRCVAVIVVLLYGYEVMTALLDFASGMDGWMDG